MSKFGHYGGGTPALPSRDGKVPAGGRLQAALARADSAAREAGKADEILHGKPVRIAIALDATASMTELLRSAKKSIAEIVRRAASEAARPIAIELFVYRDYDVPDRLVERSGATDDPRPLIAWLDRVEPTGGGANGGEAIEAALDLVVRDGGFAAVLLAGDEPSNGPEGLAAAGRSNTADARTLARRLGEAKVPIHSFVVGDYPPTISDFQKLSAASGGKSGRLDGSSEMIDLAVMAILATLSGAAGVRRYAESNRLSTNARDFAQLLIGSR